MDRQRDTGVALIGPRPALRKIYDSAAPDYLLRYPELPSMERAWLRSVLRGHQTPDVILDAAGGTGLCGQFVSSVDPFRTAMRISVDFSLAMLQLDRGATPVCGDFRQLPLSNYSVDVHLNWYGLAHASSCDLQAIFTEARRTLADKGVLLLAAHLSDGLPDKLRLADFLGTGTAVEVSLHSEEDLVAAARRAGFSLARRDLRGPSASELPTTRLLASFVPA